MLPQLTQGPQRTICACPLTLRPQLPVHYLLGGRGKGRSRVSVFVSLLLLGLRGRSHCWLMKQCLLAVIGGYTKNH